MHGLMITARLTRRLSEESFGLILRVVKLGKAVRDFSSCHYQFKAIGHARIVIAAPGQRGHFGGIFRNERGCNQPRLHRFLKYLGLNSAEPDAVFEDYPKTRRHRARAGQVIQLMHCDTGIEYAYRFLERHPRERFTKIQRLPLVLDLGATQHCLA